MSKKLNIISNTYSNGVGKIVFDGQIEELPNEMFKDNTKIVSLSLPDDVKKIGSNIIKGCSSLQEVGYRGGTYSSNSLDELKSVLNQKGCQIEQDSLDLVDTSSSPNTNGHEYVDLGITNSEGKKILFARCNVGASNEYDYGLFFQWGDTQGYSDASTNFFSWSSYKYCNGSQTTLTKYNNSSSYGTVDNKTTLELSDDAARVNMGGDWRLPTYDELNLLLNNTIQSGETINSVRGTKFISKSDSSKYIFVPLSGYWSNAYLSDRSYYFRLWTSSLHLYPNYSWYLYGGYYGGRNMGYYHRYFGYSCRGVILGD